MKKLFVAISLLFAVCLSSFAQQEDFPNFKGMKTGKGYMLTNKSGSLDYAVLIPRGKSAEHQDLDGTLKISTPDGEIYVASGSLNSLSFPNSKPVEEVLRFLEAKEISKLERMKGVKLKAEGEAVGWIDIFDTRKGANETSRIPGILWSVATDAEKKSNRYYQIAFIDDSFLMIRKDYSNNEEFEKAINIFQEISASITLLPPQKRQPAPKKAPRKKAR